MKKHYIPLDGKSNRQPLTLSFDSLLVQQIDDAVFTSRILQFLNDPKGGVKQLDNPKKQRLFASKENRSAFLE